MRTAAKGLGGCSSCSETVPALLLGFTGCASVTLWKSDRTTLGTGKSPASPVVGRMRRGGAAGAGGPFALTFLDATKAGADVALCRGFLRASPYNSCKSFVICSNVGLQQNHELRGTEI